jgi:sec-independent protein translocase protein TatA
MSGALSPTHWLIIFGVLVVLFGAKKLPDAARGLGQALRIFRSELSAPPPRAAGGDEPATGRHPAGDDRWATRGTTEAPEDSSARLSAEPGSGDAVPPPDRS